MKQFCKWWLYVFVIFLVAGGVTSAQDEWMPDPNLRQAVREALELPDGTPLTQPIINQLTELNAANSQITDLTGLEHAINLTRLDLGVNDIRNIFPLAGLTHLEVLLIYANPLSDISSLANLLNLKRLDMGVCQITDISALAGLIHLEALWISVNPLSDISPLASLVNLKILYLEACQISDISPLANLTKLELLQIPYNQIHDITPLANLTELTELNLSGNRIVDVSPLVSLSKLEKLWIQGNQIVDHIPLQVLSLMFFEYDESCVLPSLPIHERIENRRFPSIFTAWGGIGWSSVLNLPEKSDLEQMALHDLYVCCLIFNQQFRETPEGTRVVGEINQAIELRDTYLVQNPNMLFFAGLEMREAYPTSHPVDSPYWLRDENGERIAAWRDGALFLDFTKPIVVDKIVEEAIAVSKCGLYDGIFFDWWTEDSAVLANSQVGWAEGFRGYEAEQRARDEILQRIRAQVPDDFLILVNGNRRKIPRTAWGINGTFMETGRYEGYTYADLKEIESTLLWAEENLREPRINCLEGWGIPTESPDSLSNLRWMRVFTTMSLTHSDGYVLYNDGIQHQHYWYDFWNADLGQPIGEKAQLYENREGLFMREFTNGWAVYNRSGETQEIRLSGQATGVESGLRNTFHVVPDLDGEIYLKSTTDRYDINGDGTVNILDLVAVAGGFATDTPDVNGDGIVNILDLVAVTNAFWQ